MYGPQGNLNEKVAKGHEQSTNGDVISGMYPDISLPQWKDYRDSLQKYNADTQQDYNSLGGMGTWAAYEGFRQVVESISGDITSASFLKAAATAKIDLPGMVPPEDFSKTWDKDGGPKGFDRLVHRCVVFSKLGERQAQGTDDEVRGRVAARGRQERRELRLRRADCGCGPPLAAGASSARSGEV